ncbi:MAG: FAD binding domain-containing protein [Burkholderiaceae bacterium]
MHAFEYRRAESVADARLRLQTDPEARLLAGGMTLLPTMKMRLAAPSALIDIARLGELQQVSTQAGRLRLGAGLRHAVVAKDPGIRSSLPVLSELAEGIGDPQVRARGTLGGSVANNDPAADYPAAVLGLDGIVHTDQRDIQAADYFQGLFATALQPAELITAVSFRVPAQAAYAKFAQSASGYAMTGVLVARFDDGWRVAVTGAGPGVFRWTDAEAALTAGAGADAFGRMAIDESTLNSDLHAPAGYRAQLMRVMAARAFESLTGSR